MDDLQRMRAFERVADRASDPHDALGLEHVLGLDHGIEGAAGDELHDEVEDAVVRLAEIEHPDSVGVTEPTRELCLAEEALDHIWIGDQVWADDLDRHLTANRVLGAAIDRTHAALTQ